MATIRKFSFRSWKEACTFETENILDHVFPIIVLNNLEGTESGLFKGSLCVHFRRRDDIRSRPTHILSVNSAAHQIKQKFVEYNLTSVFMATDTTEEECEELSRILLPYKTFRYEPSPAVLQKYKGGGIAIIEQIICSHARYFVGSFESTFSFRIQEERELLNMDPDTTFNRLCGDTENNCQQSTRWRLVQ